MSKKTLYILLGFAVFFTFVVLSNKDSEPTSNQTPSTAEVDQDPAQATIDAWLTAWSTAQASSVRETCEQEPGCDPGQYAPEARPETSFGWDGAQAIERIDDWARGPRYVVQANGRTLIVYLEDNPITGVYLTTPGRWPTQYLPRRGM